MGQAPSKSVEDKVRLISAALRGEILIATAPPREGISAVSISKWRDVFLAGGQRGLDAGAVPVRRVVSSSWPGCRGAEPGAGRGTPGVAALERGPRSGTTGGGRERQEVL